MELFTYKIVQQSLLTSLLIGGACSLIGVFVVLRGLSFIGVGIANAAFAGVALGFLAGTSPILTAVAVSLIVVWLIGHTSKRSELKLDASIGIFFAATMALGLFFMGLMPDKKEILNSYLFGNILMTTKEDLILAVLVFVGVALCIFVFFKEFHFIIFDHELANASGIPATVMFYLLLGLTAITIIASLKVVGEILVIAMIIIPAAAACQLTYNVRKALLLSFLFGITASFFGIILSYYLRWLTVPTGAIMVIIATSIFLVTAAFSPKGIR
ncbi:metal ABC transporter permease [Candidatus Desantisbacteria bacterium]|nr:metal ABC transporter permease [Candidatus Desantisbacteria bacterium]